MPKKSNEQIVAEIQSLTHAGNPEDKKTLADLQEELWRRSAAVVTTLARKYNRGHPITEDEKRELPLAVFDAARKYDSTQGTQFSTYLAYYVRSALQREHAFTHGQSQSKYARAARMLNNPEKYDRKLVRHAETFLQSKKSFREETDLSDSNQQMSAEDYFFANSKIIDEVEAAVGELAMTCPKQAQVVTLKLGLGVESEHDTREIAGIIKTKERNVNKLFQSGLAKIRQMLTDDNGTMSTDLKATFSLALYIVAATIAIHIAIQSPGVATATLAAGLTTLAVRLSSRLLAKRITRRILAKDAWAGDPDSIEPIDLAA